MCLCQVKTHLEIEHQFVPNYLTMAPVTSRSQTQMVLKWHNFTLIFISIAVAIFGTYGERQVSTNDRPNISNKSIHASAVYRPVILVHGIFAVNNSLGDLKRYILEARPGINITSIPLYEEIKSIEPLWRQVPKFAAAMRPIMQHANNGVTLICYSQGGIICRGILETMSDHNVHTFIALSTPQMGQYGDTSYIIPFLPKLRKDVYKFCYTELGQQVSVCNYWNGHRFNALLKVCSDRDDSVPLKENFKVLIVTRPINQTGLVAHNIRFANDPLHQTLYKQKNNYLPVLNNEVFNAKSQEWKANFLRLKKMVMIGGPDDGVITPWQSSHFGFYDANVKVVEMQDQEVYKKDSFGLQSLDKRNALKTYVISGVHHHQWHGNQTVFDCCIEPWLT